jgi:hypothetical protein
MYISCAREPSARTDPRADKTRDSFTKSERSLRLCDILEMLCSKISRTLEHKSDDLLVDIIAKDEAIKLSQSCPSFPTKKIQQSTMSTPKDLVFVSITSKHILISRNASLQRFDIELLAELSTYSAGRSKD